MSDTEDGKNTFEIVGGEPHSWFMTARQLKKSADLVGVALRDVLEAYPNGRAPFEEIAIFNGYMLLAGLAVESLVKGILVGRNPKAVSPTRFDLNAISGSKQARIGDCVHSWAHETPEVRIAYDLFCDLVHPNIGSTFLVASTSAGRLYFSRFRGEPVGRAILEQSLLILVSVTHRPFGEYLAVLMGTIWQDDEFVM